MLSGAFGKCALGKLGVELLWSNCVKSGLFFEVDESRDHALLEGRHGLSMTDGRACPGINRFVKSSVDMGKKVRGKLSGACCMMQVHTISPSNTDWKIRAKR